MSGSSQPNPTRRLKVFMTADAVGGVWQYAVDLTGALTARGCDVLLATMGPRPSSEQKREMLALGGVQIAESDFALEWMPDAWGDVDAAGKWLLDVAGSFAPDIIHLNGYTHAALPWKRPVIVVLHSCVYSWWRWVHGGAPPEEWLEYKRRVEEGLKASDRVIAISRFMAAACTAEYGVLPSAIRVIYNFERLGPGLANAAKQEYCLAAGRLWDAAKNLRLLDEIAPRVKWEIRVAGNKKGPDNSNATADAVRLLGFLPKTELAQQISRAGIFLHPALYEPFGLTVLRAAAAGCCLVLSDIPSMRELWEDAAVFVDPRDAGKWAYEVNALIADSERRREMAAKAMAQAQKYCESAAADAYLDTYREAMAARERKEAAA